MNARDTLNILIVDDEDIVRRTLTAMLQYMGHRADWVADGLAGQTALNEHQYNTAFVDIRMPGMDGISLLKWSRKINPDFPIIIMTGHGVEDSCAEALKSGAFGFLNKPFSLQEIKELITKIQQQSR